jgi:hypothetical protein
VFALDLMSTYEGEHTIFGLLGQANLTQNDVLQFHPWFTFKKKTRFLKSNILIVRSRIKESDLEETSKII